MIIKLILLAGVAALLAFFVKNRSSANLRASKKLLFVGFVLAGMGAIIWPNLLNDIAHEVGVGRGTDLMLYAFILAFCFVNIDTYLKFKDYEDNLTILTREIALLEAAQTQKHHVSRNQEKSKTTKS